MYGVKKLQFSDRQLQISERLWVLKGSMFHFAPKMEENRKKQPKMSQSCAKVALCGKNCALAQKRKSCAPQHRNFLGGLITSAWPVGYLDSLDLVDGVQIF